MNRISAKPVEASPPPPPPTILTGRNLWLFRAWLYLPIPCVVLAVFLNEDLKRPNSQSSLTLGVVILVVLAILAVCTIRFERKNGLHFPTSGDIESFFVICFIAVLSNPLLQVLDHGHVDKGWFVKLLRSLLVFPICFPMSIILNSKRRKREEAGTMASSNS